MGKIIGVLVIMVSTSLYASAPKEDFSSMCKMIMGHAQHKPNDAIEQALLWSLKEIHEKRNQSSSTPPTLKAKDKEPTAENNPLLEDQNQKPLSDKERMEKLWNQYLQTARQATDSTKPEELQRPALKVIGHAFQLFSNNLQNSERCQRLQKYGSFIVNGGLAVLIPAIYFYCKNHCS